MIINFETFEVICRQTQLYFISLSVYSDLISNMGAIKKYCQTINMNKVLPARLRIVGAHCHLYRIGLSKYKCVSRPRSLFYHPIFVFFFLFQTLVRNLIFIKLFQHEKDMFYLYCGDFAHFIGCSIQMNFILGFDSLLSLTSLIFHYINYKIDIRPTDLNVFRMLSGLISPRSIGIHDSVLVLKLIRIGKLSLINTQKFINFSTVTAFFIVVISFATKIDSLNVLVYGVPHAIVLALWIHHFINVMLWQTIYFFIIAYYLDLKLKSANNKLKNNIDKSNQLKVWPNSTFIKKNLRQLNDIYLEITEYNDNYWSKYLGVFWFTHSSIIAAHIYIGVFSEMSMLLKNMCNMFLVTYIMILFYIVSISSAIYREANRTHPLLNSYLLSNNPIGIAVKIKVRPIE